MRAAIFHGPGDITVGDRPDPTLQAPTDAIVRVTLACVCGSDLWYWRGLSTHAQGSIGHEFIGVVEAVGEDVRSIAAGDLVVAPFTYNDGTCVICREGVTSQCLAGGSFGNGTTDGGQGEAVRVPFADATLVTVPGSGHPEPALRSLLALSDVMCTGHHAAVSAGVRPGSVAAVVGDGAVGLCGVLAAHRLGAERVITLSRNPARQALARAFGATDIVEARGQEAIDAVLALTGGLGADATLECVGTAESVATAFGIARRASTIGMVGVPHDAMIPPEAIVFRNVGLRGGVTPARAYIPELLPDVLDGRIDPGLVFDFQTDLDGIAGAYTAMDERRAVKSLVRVGTGS